MTGTGVSGSSDYLAEHIRTVLATDQRVLEQGLEVTVIDEMIAVRGTVATSAQRDAVSDVVHELAPGAEIVNDVEVPPNPEPGGAEKIS